MDEYTAHEDFSYLRNWHDGDPRFMDRLARLEAYVAGLEVAAFGYTVGPYTGVLPIRDVSRPKLPVLRADDADASAVVPEAAVESDGGLMTTANTFTTPQDDNKASPEEVMAQAEAIMAELPEEVGGKKKAKN